jgi:colanic acid/amylovoran biosynthesis glycosyltransferase
MQPDAQIRIAYLISQYPAVNHTFILREVRRLRALGLGIQAISIAAPDRPASKMTEDEREELARTLYVKRAGLKGAIVPHLQTCFSRPLRYLKGLCYALKLGRFHPRNTLYHLFYFAEAVIVGQWMNREKLSHVHTHFSSTVGLILKSIFPINLSITIHGPDEFNDPVGFHLTDKIEAASFICAISNYARSQLMKISQHSQWEKIEVSPLGVDPTVFAPRPFREAPAPFELICVGRLAPAKAQHVLVAAVDTLVREGRDVRLRLVGDGTDRRSLEEDVAARGLTERVVFEGWLNQDAVRALYGQTDVFTLASFAEGVPVVLMEAMAMEIPCVATNITGVPELIRDGVDGLLAAPSDTEALAEKIASLIDDAALRRKLGEAGRRRVMEKYDLQRNTDRLANIFRRRIGTHGAEASSSQPVMQKGVEERVEVIS